VNEPFSSVSKCPHCGGERSFRKAVFDDGKLMMAVWSIRAMDNANYGFTLGGPHIDVLFKYCDDCGYMAPFSKSIVNTKRL